MIEQFPLVSLVITSYNCAHYIDAAISSALAQDYPNLEVVISDNCSTDNSDGVIRRYTGDPRVRYSINDRNIGMLPNFLKATRDLARGKYVTYVSSDDYLINERFISEAVARIRQFPTVLMVHSINVAEITASQEFFLDASYLRYKDSFYKQPFVNGLEVFNEFPECHSISFGGTLFEREKLLVCNPFQGKILSGDSQVALKMLLMGDAAFIDRKTYVARRHSGSATYSVVRAQTYIDNLDYIDEPFRFAQQQGFLDKDEAVFWRQQMYVCCFSQCLRHLYKVNRTEYATLVRFLRDREPEVLATVTSTLGWKLERAIFASRLVGNCYLWLRRMARKVRNLLSGASDRRSLIESAH